MINISEITNNEYTNLLTIIAQSVIENEYIIGELQDGVIIITRRSDYVSGYIYKTLYEELFIFCDNKSILLF
jgi:hypothetical protein